MANDPIQPLLGANDPPPVQIINPAGAASFLLIGDHAGCLVPKALGDLGVSEADRCRHIGWDIGVARLGEMLAERLDAVFIRQTYSRLVIDCNRAPGRADAMPEVSDGTPIPANVGLTPTDRAAREAAIQTPYQDAIAAELAKRDARGERTVLIALHSFTPRMKDGAPRPWQIGILHDGGDVSFAKAMLAALEAEGDLTVGDNEPYRMDQIDYTIPRHAYAARRPYAEIEVRQDLLGDEAGCRVWAERLGRVLVAASQF